VAENIDLDSTLLQNLVDRWSREQKFWSKQYSYPLAIYRMTERELRERGIRENLTTQSQAYAKGVRKILDSRRRPKRQLRFKLGV